MAPDAIRSFAPSHRDVRKPFTGTACSVYRIGDLGEASVWGECASDLLRSSEGIRTYPLLSVGVVTRLDTHPQVSTEGSSRGGTHHPANLRVPPRLPLS
ncbi:hypothetical protein GCM10018785_10570 [Streptomyces longispororuber]|uniref:Uncharacterized protein n=1 Tax=Streptomyces longispororuber TaxID=68230 RepID=A0A918ZB39_9ACTN|nr:hypothetical protein GCM10018785_10570 [Streptomyces longispororuber]